MSRIAESELIINPDGSIFHLHLQPEQLADTVLLVGDQGRVDSISKYFDKVEHKVQNREFTTHTGYFNGKRISALSTGIGTDNIDIVLNELDALVNIDLKTRTINPTKKSLDLIRLGTSGALQEHIPVDSFVVSAYGLGFDGLLNFYETNQHPYFEKELAQHFVSQVNWPPQFNTPYLVKGDATLIQLLEQGMHKGITATASGFYGPQGRQLRLAPAIDGLNEKLTRFEKNGLKITNFEMETSALYGLGALLGHKTATVCAIIANRIRKEYSKDYKVTVDKLIQLTLQRLTG
jgi:uridine phosphorylase